MRRHWRLIAIVAAVAVVAVLAGLAAAGVFSGSSSTTTAASTTSAQTWAGGVCTAFSTWKADLDKIAKTVSANPTKESLQQGLSDAKAATSTLKDTLKGLGTPDTQASTEAKKTLDQLQTQLDDDVTAIQQAIDKVSGASGSVEAISAISSTLLTMRDQLTAASDSLGSLPTGELEQAFKDAPACATLRGASTGTTGGE